MSCLFLLDFSKHLYIITNTELVVCNKLKNLIYLLSTVALKFLFRRWRRIVLFLINIIINVVGTDWPIEIIIIIQPRYKRSKRLSVCPQSAIPIIRGAHQLRTKSGKRTLWTKSDPDANSCCFFTYIFFKWFPVISKSIFNLLFLTKIIIKI